MVILLTIVHVIVCLFLILVVLLQSGKAADLAGAFGGMGSQTTFGPRGAATALSKATTIAAVLFMVTSMSLAVLQTRDAARNGGVGGGSVLERTQPKSTGGSAVPAVPPAAMPKPAQTAPGGAIPLPIDMKNVPAAPASGAPAPAATPAPAKK